MRRVKMHICSRNWLDANCSDPPTLTSGLTRLILLGIANNTGSGLNRLRLGTHAAVKGAVGVLADAAKRSATGRRGFRLPGVVRER